MRNIKSTNLVFKFVTVACAVTVALSSPSFAGLISIASDVADGGLHRDLSPFNESTTPVNTVARVGISGGGQNSTRVQNNAIYFFELPNLVAGEQLTSSDLSIPYVDKTGVSPNLSFGMDVWGLGYIGSAVLNTDWLLFSENDLGAGLGVASRTKIQDDILTPGSFDPNSNPVSLTTNNSGDTNLLMFIQSLYSGGASGGDFAVIRLNPDQNKDPDGPFGTPGYIVGFNEHAGLSPTLTLTSELTIVPEPSTYVLIITGLLGLGIFRRKRKNQIV